MLSKINVLIFANEKISENPKAISSIGHIPILKHIISSLKKLKDEYDFSFIIICHTHEKEMIEDEMERWEKTNILYLSTIYRDMNINIFYNYIQSTLFLPADHFMITSLYFPFFSDSLFSYFLENYNKNPSILIGNLPYGEKRIPRIKIKNEKGIFSNEGDYNFLFLTIMEEYTFKQIYSIYYPVDEFYYHCIHFKAIVLPTYYSSYEIYPYITRKDLDYLKYIYFKHEEKMHQIQLKKIWNKLKKIETFLKKI